jgi:hypothetical protein
MTPEDLFDAVENGTAAYVLKFRPQYWYPVYQLQSKRDRSWENYNFEKYYSWDRPIPINRKTLLKIHGQLHYLAHHAPLRVQKKWESAERRFSAKHMPDCYYWKWAAKYTPNGWI